MSRTQIASTSGIPGTGAPPPPGAPQKKKRRTKAQIAADAAADATEPTNNGVTRPGAGTESRKVWDAADRISAAMFRPATKQEVVQACINENVNAGTAQTKYLDWARFWGLEGAGPATLPPATPQPQFSAPPPVDVPGSGQAFAGGAAFVQPGPDVVIDPRPLPTQAEAWEAGYKAYQEGYRADRCPYVLPSPQGQAWGAGWESGLNDEQAFRASSAG